MTQTGEDGDTSLESAKRTGVKYAQFSLIGGSNALVDLGVLTLLLLLWLLAHWLVAHTDLSPLAGGNVAKVVSMAGASTLSFVLLRFFVFRKTQ